MTTTANALHPEDESRMLSYNLPDNPERIREVLISQALGRKEKHPPLDTEPWFKLHEFVGQGNLGVVIPYAKALASKLPMTHNRVQRDFPQVLSLITAHALMHQCTRERDADGKVIATLEDYREVHRLIAEPLSQGLEVAVPNHIREVVETVKELRTTKAGWEKISQIQVAQYLGRDQSVISRNISAAVKDGYLVNNNPGQGRVADLELGERELPSGSVLPTPEELAKAE